MYKLILNEKGNIACIYRVSDNTSIPTNPDNTDYANFKAQILADEAQLQDAEGATMTAAEAKAYIATLP